MKVADFDYNLPQRLIAQRPLEDRGASRLLVVDKHDGRCLDETFANLPAFLQEGDVLVINDTKVLPARLKGKKAESGAAVEILLLREVSENRWECLLKNAKKVRIGTKVSIAPGFEAVCVAVGDDGVRLMDMVYEGDFLEIIERLGEAPLPPYIREPLSERERYQTVYAKHAGSAAAPTAGFHFTPEMFSRLETAGIEVVSITLHVGLATFRPVNVEDVDRHKMHSERYMISEAAATAINRAKAQHRRVIAVGTTSARTLETAASDRGVVSGTGESELFIYPGFDFNVIDGLLTNFHLPKSTLLMLVSAFASKEIILASYRYAIDKNYRFYSFGDAMFLTDIKK